MSRSSQYIPVEQANKMLPLLRKIAEDLRKTWSSVVHQRARLEAMRNEMENRDLLELDKGSLSEQHEELTENLHCSIDKVNALIKEVEDLGCSVQEFKRGIVNFPSLLNGRKILLCWEPEEEKVTSWHECDGTYQERLSIEPSQRFMWKEIEDGMKRETIRETISEEP